MNRINPSHAAQADLVLKNGFIYTMDRDHTLATALVVSGDSIIFVGDDSGALQIASAQSRVIDLRGKLVLPGFFDCHTHAPCGADEIYSVILNNVGSLEEYRQAIRAFLEAHPDISLLRGVGWHPPFFPPEGPSRQLLDEWAPGIPAVLYAQDYHSAWVNTKALELAGITQATQNPVGGIIQRDASGYPSGTLHESAMELVESIIPPYTVDQLVEGLKYFQQTAHSYGITSIHIPHLGDVDRELEALYRMVDEETLDLRVVAGLVVQPEDDLSVVEKLVEQRRAVKEHMQAKGKAGNPACFEITSAKIFIDGVIESATAYLEQPYAHRPDWRGESLWEAERYKADVRGPGAGRLSDPRACHRRCGSPQRAGWPGLRAPGKSGFARFRARPSPRRHSFATGEPGRPPAFCRPGCHRIPPTLLVRGRPVLRAGGGLPGSQARRPAVPDEELL